ncbi:hypothetical protein [Pseudomonas sp. NPDC087615]|uniref:hypothetical protein n=1 Tax=Pseudomonas sp. NPDC087615 TaxID=3364443 RepID=UPI00381D59BC
MNDKVHAQNQGWRVMIKRVFIAATVMFTSLAVNSANLPNELLEECQRVENSARAIMKARQEGVPLTTVLEMADTAGKESEYVGNLYKGLIGKAYDFPRQPNVKMQQDLIAEFQKTYYSLCIDNAQKTSGKRT